jgi:hypothetical protein
MARTLHEHGAFLLDLSPQNLVTDPEHGLKVLDWEFLQDLPQGAGRLGPASSPTVLGRVTDVPDADAPLRGNRTVFHPAVSGAPAGLLLRAPWKALVLLMEPGLLAVLCVHVVRSKKADATRALRRVARRAVLGALSRLEAGRPPHREPTG